MFSRTYPPQTYKSDATFFNGGFRLSDDFIKREHLQNFRSIWIYINKSKNRLGLKFHLVRAPQSISLTPSSHSTAGKTVWCSYLKKYSTIQFVMENKEIKNRRFPVKKIIDGLSSENEKVDYEIDLSEVSTPIIF